MFLPRSIPLRLFSLLLLSVALGVLSYFNGLGIKECFVLGVFSSSILGTLFFWNLRHGFVFIGTGILMAMDTISLESFIRYAAVDVILFLIAMMIIVGMMRDTGLFEWLITWILRFPELTGGKLMAIIMAGSAVFSSVMGEVASILVVTLIVLNICDFLDMDPVPLVIASVVATNIGSAATVLGNPVGVLIATRGGLSFYDFLVKALPLSTVILVVTIFTMLYVYRNYVRQLTERIKPHLEDRGFLYLISIPSDRRTRVSILIFIVTVVLIAFHEALEHWLGLEQNMLLIMIPVVSAGVVVFYRRDRIRHYIESEVEWPSILFFLFLFAMAGIVHAAGIADFFIQKMIDIFGTGKHVLTAVVVFSSGFFSGVIDNVVTVAAYIPILKSLETYAASDQKLWWALLFGACYGGNISTIGSAANIVALGILEKQTGIRVVITQWIKVGLIVGVISMVISYLALVFLPIY